MKEKHVDEVLIEIERFMTRANKWKSDHSNDRTRGYRIAQSSQAAAVKRASMDLTRALSKLRQDV